MVLPLDMHFHRNPYEERLDFGTFPCVVKSTSERRPTVPDRPSHSHCNTNQKTTSLLTPSCHPTMDDNSAPTASGQNHAAGSQTIHAPFQTPMNPTHPHSRPSRPQRPAATTALETVKVTPSLSLKKLALQFVATLKDIEDVRVVKGAIGNAFDGGPVQPRTIGLDQSVQMTKQLVWDLDQLVQHLDRLFGLLVETVCRV